MSSLSLVATKTFALKLKIHCNGCEKKLKQMLLKVQGVHSVQVDAKQGQVLITGTVDPPTIQTMLKEKLGRKAELLWEQGPLAPSATSPTDCGKDVGIVTQSPKAIKSLSIQDIMENPEQFSGIPGLKTVEVTSTIKLSFKNGSVTEITSTRNDVQSVQRSKPLALPPPSPGHHHGLCAASSSCSGGHAVSSTHGPQGCCFHGNGYLGSCGMHSLNNCCQWQSPRVAFGSNVSPPGPAPPWEFGIPSAPPMPSDYEPSAHAAPPPPPQLAPVRANTYPTMFSDENPESCIIV